MKLLSLIILVPLLFSNIYSQDSIYFNNIYQHNNNFAIGMTILETDDGYVGYGGTEDPGNIGQMLLFFKIDKQGEEVIWKPFGEDYHSYYFGNVGGAMIKTNDGNFALAYHAANNGIGYSTLLKLSSNLDTIWKKNYTTENYWTLSMNCLQTKDNGYILTGSTKPGVNDYWDVLALKTDSLGNMQWYQSYGTNLHEQGESIIETPDGGYLIGGFRHDPAEYHSLDALVIKTDSLGNEEWTKTYGNPNVDDDMAHVALADDGNFLVATTYGEWVVSPSSRTGRICLVKVNTEGITIWQKKIGPKMRRCYIDNIRETLSGDIISTGFSYHDTISFTYTGWMYKFSQEGDSIWLRDYNFYNNQYDWNMLYDAYPCTDKGFISIGLARPDMGTEKFGLSRLTAWGAIQRGVQQEFLLKSYP